MQNSSTQPERALGPMIGLIIILVIILVGGVYFYSTIQKSTRYENQNNGSNSSITIPADSAQSVEQTSTSSDTDTIEADLNAYGGAAIDNIDPNF